MYIAFQNKRIAWNLFLKNYAVSDTVSFITFFLLIVLTVILLHEIFYLSDQLLRI